MIFENESIASRAVKLGNISEMNIYLVGSNVPVFENCKQVLYHSTLVPKLLNYKEKEESETCLIKAERLWKHKQNA